MIKENDKLIIIKDDSYKVIIADSKNKVYFEKCNFYTKNLIGSNYEDCFTVIDNELVKIEDRTVIERYEINKVEEFKTYELEETRDNRNIFSSHRNQAITTEDIANMKIQGESGDVILDKLIKNSKSFDMKTKYAQEKYLKKKKKQYLPLFTVHRVTTRKLCQMYQSRSKMKILNLRFDTLSQILSLGNVHCDTKVLLVENVCGLLLGAILERGSNIINFYHGSAPVLPEFICNWNEVSGKVFNMQLQQMVPLICHKRIVNHITNENKQIIDKNENSSDNIDDRPTKRLRLSPCDYEQRKQEREYHRNVAANYIINGLVDSVIIATKFNALPIVEQSLKILASGKPMVVYNQYLQPLVELYDYLMPLGLVGNLQISESFLTSQQVLPDRTHPFMMTSGTGGYILSCIKMIR